MLLGTVYPLFMDALGLGKISVGFPYFNKVFIPLMIPLVVLMGIGPLTRWKRHHPGELVKTLWLAAVISAAAGALVALPVFPGASIAAGAAVALASWIVLSSIQNVRGLFRHGKGLWQGLSTQSRSYYGMLVAHLGVAFFVIGVTFVTVYGIEKDVRMEAGEAVELAGYSYRFEGVRIHAGPNYESNRGRVIVTKNGERVAELLPEKRTYRVQRNPMTEAAIDAGFLRDIYVSLGEPLAGGAWSVRLYYKPFVRWIWLGCLFMAFGGVLAITDPRYRLARKLRRAQAEAGLPGALATARGV